MTLSQGLTMSLTCFALGFVTLTACNKPAAPAPAPKPTKTQTAPAPKPGALTDPVALGSTAPAPPTQARRVEVTDARVQQGKALFGTCMGCHGQDAKGRLGIGPRIASASYLAAASDDFLINTIKHGRAGTTMIPWGAALNDDQIQSIVAYLRSLYPVAPAKIDYAAAEGDVAVGERVFREICSGCHGRFGAGYQETANGTGIGRKAFLDSAADGFIRYIIKHGKTQTPMKGFDAKLPTAVANLSDQQIDGTIAYLRKNAW